MKRAIWNWSVIGGTALAVILAALWVVSYFIDPWQYELTIAHDWQLAGHGPELHLMSHDGYISVFNDTDIDRQSGKRTILKVYSRNSQPLDPVTTHIAWDLPGFKLFYCRLTSGNATWSLELTLLVPIVFPAFLVGVLLRRRYKSTPAVASATCASPNDRMHRSGRAVVGSS